MAKPPAERRRREISRGKFLKGKFLKFGSLKWHFQHSEKTFWKIFRFSKQDFNFERCISRHVLVFIISFLISLLNLYKL
jgi:hypothetical protein